MSNMIVQTNVLSLNGHRNMKLVGNEQTRASHRLSSGFKINSAADDAAGLAISEKMRAQIRGLDMASKNSQDAISLIQTAEGGMQEVDNMLQRIRELVDQAANDTNEHNTTGTGDRQKIQDEIDQLVAEIDSMSNRVEFNKKKVIDGSFADNKGQLATAKSNFDAASLSVSSSNARLTALTSALGDDTTTGLVSELTSAQNTLDSAQVTFDSAVQALATEEVTFNTALSTYTNAKNTLTDLLSTAGLTTSNITSGLISDMNSDNAEMAGALTAAIDDYSAAAIALGLDELKLGENSTLIGVGNNDISGLVSGVGASTIATSISSIGDASNSGAYSDWNSSNVTFASDKAVYSTAVAMRDAAQAAVSKMEGRIAEAQTELKNANTNFRAADIVYSTASEADRVSSGRALHFQVGANSNQSLLMSIGSVKSNMLGIGDGEGNSAITVLRGSGEDITATLDVLDNALSYVTTERSRLGAAQNRLEYTIKSLDISSENMSSAESRIRDTDMAKEMMNYTKSNVLQQAAISMLAQANQAPQSVLQLLG